MAQQISGLEIALWQVRCINVANPYAKHQPLAGQQSAIEREPDTTNHLVGIDAVVVPCIAQLIVEHKAAADKVAEEETYLEIDRDGVYLHENTRKADVLFMIPRTFYVKIVDANYDPDYLLVEYNGVEGLIKGSDVSGKTLTDVANPYYTATTVSAHADTYLYTKPAISSKTNLAAYGLTLTFLGKTQGEQHNFGTATWYAVLYADHVYFIHSAMTENLNLLESSFAPVHPNSVATKAASATEAEESSDEATPTKDSFDVVRLLLIIGVIVPIVIIMFLLFHPKRRRPNVRRNSGRERYYRDEEEYDDDY